MRSPAQVFLDRHYQGQHRVHLFAASHYQAQEGRNYWTDLVKLHMYLGLGVAVGGASAIVPLTSHKDHEVMVIADDVNDDFVFLLCLICMTR